jgi:hypothetical protein
VLTILLPAQLPAQSPDPSQLLEERFGQPDDDEQPDQYENALQVLTSPVDLNKVARETLESFGILSAQQVKSFFQYRQEFKSLESIYELQAVPEFDLETIRQILPLVTVNPPRPLDSSYWKSLGEGTNSYILLRYGRELVRSVGYSSVTSPDSRFTGTPDKLYLRLRTSRPNDFSVGITAEKDAGESFSWQPRVQQYGFDFLAGHIQLLNKGRVKNLIIGDLQLQFGQGLSMGGVLGTGKGSETITAIRKSNVGLAPYTSAYEAGNLRGVGTTVTITSLLSATLFYAGTRRDATIVSDTAYGKYIATLQTDGRHRNEKELSTRKLIREDALGGVFQFQKNQLDLGLTFQRLHYPIPIRKNPTAYNQFAFSGTANNNIGVYGNYGIDNYSLFAELVHSVGAGTSLLTGALFGLGRRFEGAAMFRYYDRHYHPFYSNALSEGSEPKNETGLYWGWRFAVDRRLSFNGYLDLFRFPWLRFRNYSPSSGYEWLARLHYKPSRNVVLYLLARQETKTRNDPEAIVNYIASEARKCNYRLNIEYGVREKLRLKTRVQFSTFRQNNRTTRGFALIQDAQASVGKVRFTFRYALFDADDHDNRQYAYENDVYLAYSFPAYAGQGARKVAMVDFKHRKVHFWLRYGMTRLKNVDTIGSGIDTMPGNNRSEIRIQLMYTF